MKSKSKKILSLLLSVLLIVSAIPLTASAALEGTATTDVVRMKLSVSPTFGGTTWIDMDEGELVIDSIQTYNDTDPADYGNTFKSVNSEANITKNLQGSIDAANAVYDATKDSIEVAKSSEDQTIYLGVKTSLENATTYKGIYGATFYVKYDNTVFAPDATGDINAASATNKILSGSIRLSAANAIKWASQSYGNMTYAKAGYDTVSGETDKSIFAVQYNTEDRKWYIPQAATAWDFVIPIKVKANTPAGTYKLEVADTVTTSSGAKNVSIELNAGEQNNSTDLGTGTKATFATSNENRTHLVSNDVTVIVTAPPAAPEIASTAYGADGTPTITFATGDDKASAGDLKYQIDDGPWTSLSATAGDGTVDTGSNSWTLGSTVVNALISGKKVLISADENKAANKAYTVQIGTAATGDTGYTYTKINQNTVPTTQPVIVFKYASKTAVPATANASAVEVSTDAKTWGASATIADTATKVYYRAKGNANGLPSNGSTTFRTSTAAGTGLTVDTTTTWATKIEGKTTLAAPASELKYSTTSAADAATGTAFSTATDVAADTTKTVYLYKAPTDGDGTADGTPAQTGSVKGVGFVAPTSISATTPTEPDADVVVTFPNDAAQFQNNTGIVVNDGTSDVAGVTVTLGDAGDGTNNKATISGITWDTSKTYTIKVAAASVKPQPAAELTATVKLSQSGYKLPATVTPTNTGASTVTLTANPAGVVSAGGKTTVTLTGFAEGESMESVSADIGTATKVDGSTFTYTAPSADPGSVQDVTITIATKFGAIQAKAVVADREYDGTTNATITKIVKTSDSTEVVGDFSKMTAAFEDKNVGTKTVNVSGTFTANDGKTYEVAATTTAIISQTELTNVAIAGVVVTDKTVAGIASSINDAAVTLNGGTDTGIFSEIFDKADLETVIEDALINAGKIKNDSVELAVEDNDPLTAPTLPSALKVGDVITVTLPEGCTLVSVAGTGYTDNGDGTVTVTATAVNESLTITYTEDDDTSDPKTEKTLTVSGLATINPAQVDETKIAVGDTLTVTITGANINAWASDAVKGNYKNLTNPNATVSVEIKSTGGSSASGYGVTYDDKGYGKTSAAYGEADSEGKITDLPTVTDVVLGATFLGWSTDGTKAHIIDPETYVVKGDITLTAVYEGYMAGYEDGTAKPTRNVTRAELARMLVVASGKYDASKDYGKPSFSDAQNGWYVPYIACAEDLGILHGDGNAANTVRPNSAVTREEASIMIANAFGVKVTAGGTTDKVTDFDTVSKWAKDYVAALCNNGTINGYEDQTFRGKRNIQRAEAAQMINIYLGLTETAKDAIEADTSVVSPFSDVKTKNWMYANIMFASLSVPASYYTTEITMPEAE